MLRKVLSSGQVNFPKVEAGRNPIATPLHIGLAVVVPEDGSVITYEVEEDWIRPPISVVCPYILGGEDDLY